MEFHKNTEMDLQYNPDSRYFYNSFPSVRQSYRAVDHRDGRHVQFKRKLQNFKNFLSDNWILATLLTSGSFYFILLLCYIDATFVSGGQPSPAIRHRSLQAMRQTMLNKRLIPYRPCQAVRKSR